MTLTTPSLGSRTAPQMSIASNSDRQEVLPVGNRTCLTNLPKLQDSGVILEINYNHHLDQSVTKALQTDHNSKSSVPTTTDMRNTTTVSSEMERWLAEQKAKSAIQDKAEAHSQEEKSARQIITNGHPHEANSDGQIISKGHLHEAKSDGKIMAKRSTRGNVCSGKHGRATFTGDKVYQTCHDQSTATRGKVY